MIERQAIVTLGVKGPCTGQARPWLVIQSNAFLQAGSITVGKLTATPLQGAPMLRIDVQPSEENGLDRPSQVQIEKIATVPRADIDRHVDRHIGRPEDRYMRDVETALTFFLGLDR